MRSLLAAAMAAGSLAWGASSAAADNPFEVEAARANAKYGRPLSRRDVELLRRYGCYSDTLHPACDERRSRERRRDRPRS